MVPKSVKQSIHSPSGQCSEWLLLQDFNILSIFHIPFYLSITVKVKLLLGLLRVIIFNFLGNLSLLMDHL